MKINSVQKFLLIQFRQIGDVILTTPIVRILRQHYPQAQIDVLTFTVNESTWRHNPHISNLITFDRKSGFRNFLRLLSRIRKDRYDAVLDFQDTPRSTYCSLASGATHRVTWENSSRRRLYNRLVPKTKGYPSATKSNLLRPFIEGLDPERPPIPKPEVYFSEVERAAIEKILAKYAIAPDDFIVTLAPTHRREVRRWPMAFFIKAAEFLIERYNAKIFLSYGPGETEYIQSGLAAAGFTHPNLITAEFFNLLELSALMQKATFHLGNDSAPMHLATAQNLPTFSIFGATGVSWSYPSPRHVYAVKGLECQPCDKIQCRFGQKIPCMKAFEFEEIRSRLEAFVKTIIN